MTDNKRLSTLSIDIGGTFIKTMVLDANGKAITEYLKKPTPHPGTVDALCVLIGEMIKEMNVKFDRVSAGFPGVITDGIIGTAHNLDDSCIGQNLEEALKKLTGVPAKVANDADIQGYGDVKGEGVELVITLGTGVGSALFINGHLVPNLELAHHPFENDKTYEEKLGKKAFESLGVDKWCEELKKAIDLISRTFNYERLYLGGGLANAVCFDLPENVKLSKNIEGVLGGIKLWEDK